MNGLETDYRACAEERGAEVWEERVGVEVSCPAVEEEAEGEEEGAGEEEWDAVFGEAMIVVVAFEASVNAVI